MPRALSGRAETIQQPVVAAKLLLILFTVVALARFALLLFEAPGVGTYAQMYQLPAARNVAAGLPWNDAGTLLYLSVAPGYAYLVGPLWALFGENLSVIVLLQGLLDAGTAVLTYVLARRLAGHRVGLVAWAIYLCYPLAMHYTLQITPESPFSFFQALALLVFLEAISREKLGWFLAAGLIFTVDTMMRSTALLVPFALMLPVMMAYRRRPKLWACTAVVAALPLAATIGWGLRNQAVVGQFIPVQLGSGSAFSIGSDERFLTNAGKNKYRPEFVQTLVDQGKLSLRGEGTQAKIERIFWKVGLERYMMRWEQDKLDFLLYFGKKFLYVWYRTEMGHYGKSLAVFHFPLLALFILGCAVSWPTWRFAHWVLITMVAFYVGHAVIMYPLVRFIFPVMPMLFAFAAMGIFWLAGRFIPRLRT